MNEVPADEANNQYQPDFELSHHGVVREDNWPEWESKGFFVSLTPSYEKEPERALRHDQNRYGAANVYTGHAWNDDAHRPLRHMPGIGIYIAPEGVEHAQSQQEVFDQIRAEKATNEHPDSDQRSAA